MSDRFVLFALARTGSTILSRILRCHPQVRCLGEPFNNGLHDARYSQMVRDEQSLEDTMELLWSGYDGIKHVWDPYGWPFSDGGALNRHLLSGVRHKVVFLNRRNTLRRLVSLQVSEQSNVWAFDGPAEREDFSRFPVRPLDEAALRDQLARERTRARLLSSAAGNERKSVRRSVV